MVALEHLARELTFGKNRKGGKKVTKRRILPDTGGKQKKKMNRGCLVVDQGPIY